MTTHLLPAPAVKSIRREATESQVAYHVRVQHLDGVTYSVTFISSPQFTARDWTVASVTMITEGAQIVVDEPGRFGRFSPEWVRRFFA